MLKLKLEYFGHLMRRTDTGKDPDAGKDWRQEEKGTTEDEMVGWHHRLNGHEFEQAPGVGDGQGSLACCSPWGCKQTRRGDCAELMTCQVLFYGNRGMNTWDIFLIFMSLTFQWKERHTIKKQQKKIMWNYIKAMKTQTKMGRWHVIQGALLYGGSVWTLGPAQTGSGEPVTSISLQLQWCNKSVSPCHQSQLLSL